MKTDEEIGRSFVQEMHWCGGFTQLSAIGAAACKAVGEPQRMQIYGMTAEEIHNEMEDSAHGGIPDVFSCAQIAHRLANTPKPDEEEEVRREAERLFRDWLVAEGRTETTWLDLRPPVRDYWLAVARDVLARNTRK